MITATSPRSVRSVARAEWIALWLLVLSICINYADRGNLSIAEVAVQNELHLTNTQLGWLLSAFFWTYASFQMVSGWLIDRYNVVWVYAAGFFLWSGATALTGLATGFTMIFGLRLLLGASESVAYPSYSKIIAAGFPERQRGMANGLIDAGSKLGPALGALIGGFILERFGWRWLFLGIGLISLLWLFPWMAIASGIKTGAHSKVHDGRPAPRFLEIFSKRDAWGTFLGLFCGNYGWYFMLTWLPGYFIKERHYSTVMMGKLASLAFCLVAAGAVTGGWISDRWIDRGGTPTLVRKTFVIGGLAWFALLFLPSALVNDQTISLSLLLTASFGFGLFSSNHWAITQTLAGTEAAGKWTGIQNTAGNIAGIVVPPVTGFILDKTGQFYLAFVSVCALVFVGALSYLVIVGRIEPVTWKERPN